MDEARSWFKKFWSSSERRKGRRKSPLPLVAYFYWNGGVPEPRQVRDVSPTGMYLLTEQRWYPKTLITMTLMRSDKPSDDPDRCLTINVKVVREDSTGVGFEFVPSLPERIAGPRSTSSQAANSKDLSRFVQDLPHTTLNPKPSIDPVA
jgi:hypothetical protein